MLQPLHDYVLLKKEKEEKTTASGIILTSGKYYCGKQIVGGNKLWLKKYVFQKMLANLC